MAARKNHGHVVKRGGFDRAGLDPALSRRNLLLAASAAGIALAFPWADNAFAVDAKTPPEIPFKRNGTGDGVIGPYGEVRVFNVGGQMLPVVVTAAGGLATMELAGRTPFARFGAAADDTAITLTSAGVQYGKGKAPVKWSADAVRELVAALSKDRKKAKGAILLRSALHSAYPLAVKELKGKPSKGVADSLAKHAPGYGSGALKCTTKTVTDTVTTTVTKTIDVIKSAETLYQECYDKEATKDPCKSTPFPGTCAAAICALKTFVDVVVGVIEVVTTVVEEVVRTVVSCVIPPKGQWPNPWNLPDLTLKPPGISQAKASFGVDDLKGAADLIGKIGGFLGPFGKCLLEAKWSFAQLEMPLDFGDGKVVIPYGVKACITPACANSLSLFDIGGELLTSWGAALAALAAMSPEFAAAVAGFGITAAPAVAAAIAGLPAAVVAAAALILAFIILALIYGTAIVGQISVYKGSDALFGTTFLADGVCIEHPTFALALIKLLTIGIAPAELFPPIVVP